MSRYTDRDVNRFYGLGCWIGYFAGGEPSWRQFGLSVLYGAWCFAFMEFFDWRNGRGTYAKVS